MYCDMTFLWNVVLYSSTNNGTRTTCVNIDESQNLTLNETRKSQKEINPFLCRTNKKQYTGDDKLNNNKQYIKFTILIIFKYTVQWY